jgi:hypothetical protein
MGKHVGKMPTLLESLCPWVAEPGAVENFYAVYLFSRPSTSARAPG